MIFGVNHKKKYLNTCFQHFFQVGTIPPTQYIPTLAPPPQPSPHHPMLPPLLPSAPHAPSSTMGKEDLATQPWQPSAPPDRWDLLPCISIYSTYSIYSTGCARFSIISRFSMYPDLPPPTYAESVWGVANVRRQVILIILVIFGGIGNLALKFCVTGGR